MQNLVVADMYVIPTTVSHFPIKYRAEAKHTND
jgi:hypothetical protein